MMADFCGHEALARTNSVLTTCGTASLGCGPLLFGFSREVTVAWRAVVLPLSGTLVCLVALVAITPMPVSKAASLSLAPGGA